MTERNGIPVSEIDADPSKVDSKLEWDLTHFNWFSPGWDPDWDKKKDPKYPHFHYLCQHGDNTRARNVFTGKPRAAVDPGLCERLMGSSCPLENAFSTLVFDIAEQNQIKKFMDLRYIEGYIGT